MDPVDIHSAAKLGNLHRVRQLIEAGASVDIQDAKGRTPLLLAAYFGRHAVVEFLINYKLDPKNWEESESATGLFLEQKYEGNFTLLHYASGNGWADIAQTIIEKGSRSDMVNAATKDGWTPLMEAVSYGPKEDIATLLLRSGADVNGRSIQGKTVLHDVACEGEVRMVRLLLQEEGVDLNPQDEEGRTPLHFACRGAFTFRNKDEVIKQLLVAGADTNLKDKNGDTPLSIYLKKIDPSLEIVNLFVQNGAFFQECDCRILFCNFVLKISWRMENVDLCTQSIINKFSYQTLPAVYSCPYLASMLPPMNNFMLNNSQKEELKNYVRQQNTYCSFVTVRPTALSALCIQCLATYITSRE